MLLEPVVQDTSIVFFALISLCSALLAAGFFVVRNIRFICKDEQLFIEELTELRAIDGPTVVVLPILHKTAYKAKATPLGPLDYQLVKNTLTGDLRVEVGPKLLFLRPYDELNGDKKTAISLKATQYVRLLDKQTGQVRVEKGEQGKLVPGPHETYLDADGVREAISLKYYEYVRIEDKQTGITRVERGEKLVFLTGHEKVVGIVQQAVEVDDETAVLIRNKRDGQQQLITKKQVYVPGPNEEILEVQKLIKLANYEACIVRGNADWCKSTCIPGTKAQILTQVVVLPQARTEQMPSYLAKMQSNVPFSCHRIHSSWRCCGAAAAGTQFTCFISVRGRKLLMYEAFSY